MLEAHRVSATTIALKNSSKVTRFSVTLGDDGHTWLTSGGPGGECLYDVTLLGKTLEQRAQACIVAIEDRSYVDWSKSERGRPTLRRLKEVHDEESKTQVHQDLGSQFLGQRVIDVLKAHRRLTYQAFMDVVLNEGYKVDNAGVITR